jgi:hypothetical protein
MRFVVVAISVLLVASCTRPESDPHHLSMDEIAIYQHLSTEVEGAMLRLGDKTKMPLLSSRMNPLEEPYELPCVTPLLLRPSRFGGSLPQLTEDFARSLHMEMIDPAEHAKQLRPLYTLSEIRFDETGDYGVASYGIKCGPLCGTGATLVYKKQWDGSWKKHKQCGTWIS